MFKLLPIGRLKRAERLRRDTEETAGRLDIFGYVKAYKGILQNIKERINDNQKEESRFILAL